MKSTRILNDDDNTIDQPQLKILKLNVISPSSGSYTSFSSLRLLDISLNNDVQPIQARFFNHPVIRQIVICRIIFRIN